MHDDSLARETEFPAAHADDELPRATETPESRARDLDHPQEMSPLTDDYTTAEIRTLLHRLYALASQI